MPRYLPETAQLRAKKLAKSLLENDLNEAAVARELGVTKQAIHQRIRNTPVRDALQEYIESPKLKAKLISVANEALSATRLTKLGVVVDHDARHKYWHDLMISGGKLKTDGSGGVTVINIVHAYRKPKDAANT